MVPKLYQFSSDIGGKLVEVAFQKHLSLLTAGSDGHHLSFIIDECDLLMKATFMKLYRQDAITCHNLLLLLVAGVSALVVSLITYDTDMQHHVKFHIKKQQCMNYCIADTPHVDISIGLLTIKAQKNFQQNTRATRPSYSM